MTVLRAARCPGRASVCVVVSALALFGAACEPPAAQPASDDDQLAVVASMTIIGEFAEAVAGEQAAVTTIVPVGGDPHSYEPVPADARSVAEADVVLDNGFGLSPWFRSLATNISGRLVKLADTVDVDATTDRNGRVDPHLWLSPELASGYVDAIEEALARADPANAEAYAANARRYREDLAVLDEEVAAVLDDIPERHRKLVTHEDAYNYFAAHYDLEATASAVGATTEEDPSARDIRRLIDRVEREEIPAVFPQVGENPAVMERIAEDTGAAVGGALYVDSLGDPGSPAETYAGMLRANAEAVADGLGK